MLIFEFKDDAKRAEEFAAACRERGKEAFIWASQDAMEVAFAAGQAGSDIFPWVIEGTVVTVERDDDDKIELATQTLVKDFGGTYVGT